MAARSQAERRLSGWSRLWIVATVLSWMAGVADLATSPGPPQWPPPFGDLTSVSARHLLWFMAPLVVGIAWIAARWVWYGFLPRPQEVARPHMTTMGMIRQSLRVLAKVGIVLIASALAIGFAVLWFYAAIAFNDVEPSLWKELSIVVHACFGVVILSSIWEAARSLIMEDQDSKRSAPGKRRNSRRDQNG